MARRIDKSKRRLDPQALERQIGRLLERNARAGARYAIAIEDNERSDSGLRLQWQVHPEWDEWANLSEGTYILRSNVHEWSDQELWQTYIQLTEAEAAFRVHKSDLAIRPIWHQKASRIQAHILCASSATRCGRRCSSGNRAPAWVIPRAPFSPSSRVSRLLMSCCHSLTPRGASCAFAALYVPIVVKRSYLIDWVFNSRSDFERPKPSKCSGDFEP